MSNYWLNLILYENLIADLYDTYSPFIGKEWDSKKNFHDHMDIIQHMFQNNHPEYNIILHTIKIGFILAQLSPTSYILDSMEIHAIL